MHPTPSTAEQAEHFVSLLKKFHTAMLVTHPGGDSFHARPMAIAEVEDDGKLWFITANVSNKVREIELNSHVQIIAQDGDGAFLSLTGRAVLIGDREKITHIWKEPYRIWFPEGKDDPNIELIAVQPQRGEFWDTTGIHRCRYLWEAAKAYVTGTTPQSDFGTQHGTVELPVAHHERENP